MGSDLRNTIQGFIEEQLLSGRRVEGAEDLLLSGLVDSLGVMRLVSFLESSFGFKVPAQDVKLTNFATIDAIVTYVEGRAAT